MSWAISIHALREEGDRYSWAYFYQIDLFLSTPSARRATQGDQLADPVVQDFYPRPPRGGRLSAMTGRAVHVEISIHALREEGDLALSSRPYQSAIFLSTPSARRATAGALGTAYASNISIHALREEGDPPSDA